MKHSDTNTADMQTAEDYKPTYIQEQHNHNCQQFFGPISNCTFMMPAASPSSKQKPKPTKPKAKAEKKPNGKPMTLKYYRHGNNGVLMKQPYIEKQTGCSAKSLVEQQFGKSANSDRNRIDNSAEERIKLAQLILDIKNPLPEPRGRNAEEDVEIQDAALMEIFAGQLRSTKGI